MTGCETANFSQDSKSRASDAVSVTPSVTANARITTAIALTEGKIDLP